MAPARAAILTYRFIMPSSLCFGLMPPTVIVSVRIRKSDGQLVQRPFIDLPLTWFWWIARPFKPTRRLCRPRAFGNGSSWASH
jgi:hypothetical protein